MSKYFPASNMDSFYCWNFDLDDMDELASQSDGKDLTSKNREVKRRSLLPAPKSYSKVESKLPPTVPASYTSNEIISDSDTKPEPLSQIRDVTVPQNLQTKSFRKGDHVCIGGVKTGTVLYFGRTHLADGIWCGIRLNEAEGKHDGEVQGVRYFTCEPMCGIFAPVDKVEHLSSQDIQVLDSPSSKQKSDVTEKRDEITEITRQTCAIPKLPSQTQQSKLHAESRHGQRRLPRPKSYAFQTDYGLGSLEGKSDPVRSIDVDDPIFTTDLWIEDIPEPEKRPKYSEHQRTLVLGKCKSGELSESQPISTLIYDDSVKDLVNSVVSDEIFVKPALKARATSRLPTGSRLPQISQTRSTMSKPKQDIKLESMEAVEEQVGVKSVTFSEAVGEGIPLQTSRHSKQKHLPKFNDGTFVMEDEVANKPVNSTFVCPGAPENDILNISTESEEDKSDSFTSDEELSHGIRNQLESGNKQYFNLTFEPYDEDSPPKISPEVCHESPNALPLLNRTSDNVSKGGDSEVLEGTQVILMEANALQELMINGSHLQHQSSLEILDVDLEELGETGIISHAGHTPSSLGILNVDSVDMSTGDGQSVQKLLTKQAISEIPTLDRYPSLSSDIRLSRQQKESVSSSLNFNMANAITSTPMFANRECVSVFEDSSFEELHINDGEEHAHDKSDRPLDHTPEEIVHPINSETNQGINRKLNMTYNLQNSNAHMLQVADQLLTNTTQSTDNETCTTQESSASESSETRTSPRPISADLRAIIPADISNHTGHDSYRGNHHPKTDMVGSRRDTPKDENEVGFTETDSDVLNKNNDNLRSEENFATDDLKQMIDSGISDRWDFDACELGPGEFDQLCTEEVAHRADTTEITVIDNNPERLATNQDITSSESSRQARTVMTSKYDQMLAQQDELAAELRAGYCTKNKRPVSMVSSTSADTGYAADTDSEHGTITSHSPSDWSRHDGGHGGQENIPECNTDKAGAYVATFQSYQPVPHSLESDSDLYSDAATLNADSETDRDDTDMEEPQASTICGYGEGGETGENSETESTNDITEVHVSSPSSGDAAEGQSVFSSAESMPECEPKPAEIQGTELMATEHSASGEASSIASEAGAAAVDELSTSEICDSSTRVKDSASVVDSTSEHAVSVCELSQADVDVSASEIKTPVSKGVGVPDKSKTPKTLTKVKKALPKIDYKMPNLNVTSKLASYIKAAPPAPAKAKETDGKKSDASSKGTPSKVKKETALSGDAGEASGATASVILTLPEAADAAAVTESPKVVRRTPPKSKWGNIMSSIECNKDKPKPKAEVKSKLSTYLSQPRPSLTSQASDSPSKGKENKEDGKTPLAKKKILPSIPKPDYSKVKSKLSTRLPPPASPIAKRETSPKPNPPSNSSAKPQPLSDSNAQTGSTENSNNNNNGPLQTDLSESLGSSILCGSSVNSAKSSHTDLSVVGGDAESLDGSTASLNRILTDKAQPLSGLRRSSLISRLPASSANEANKSVKDKALPKIPSSAMRFANIKSSIPPPMPRPSRTPTKQPSKSATSTPKKASASPDSRTTPSSRRTSPAANQNRNNKTGGKLVGSVLARSQPDVITAKLPHTDLSKEVQNLETLCEARTKELTFTKLKLKEVTLAFDAMTVLVRYLSEELDAFSCPVLKQELASAQEQLNNKQTIISEFQDKVASLEGEIISLQEKHAEVEKGMKAEHVGAMETAEQKLKQQHREEIEKVQDRFSKDKDRLKAFHGRNIEEMNQLMQNLKLTHQEEMLLLQKKQDAQMEELHRQHKDRLEEITKRFEGIKRTLSEKVETLFCECDDLRARARMCEEALQRDTDFKVQMALAPYKDLPREIESLKTVVEMRNDEIRGLKDQKFDLEGQLEELSIAREKIISLHQKNENLEAIVNIKTDHEKQLSDKCQHLLKRCDKESRAKKRVSMDYEELMWRMNHSSEFGSDDSLYQRQLSRSPTESETNSPNVTRRAVSSNDSYINGRSNDRTASNSPPRYHGGLSVSYTEKSPRKGDSDCGSGTNSLERTFNRRSGTFIMEHKSKTPPKEPLLLSSSSPQSSICTVIQYPREQSPSSLSSDSPSVSQQMDSSLIFDCGDVFGDDDNHEQCNNNNVDVSK